MKFRKFFQRERQCPNLLFLILLHFTMICALKVFYLYCVYMVEIAWHDMIFHVFSPFHIHMDIGSSALTHTTNEHYCFFVFLGRSSLRTDYLPMQTWAAELTQNQIRHCTAFSTSRLRRQVCAGLRCMGAVCRLCCTPEKHTEHLTLLLLV